MKRRPTLAILSLTLGLLLAPHRGVAAPPAPANTAFDSYARTVESRLASQHTSGESFLVLPSANLIASLRSGPLIEHLPTPQIPGALIHHWRATQFVPGARADDLDLILKNFAGYSSIFAPQVERAQALPSPQGPVEATMRVRQHHVLTVVLDTSYDVTFAQLDPQHRYSISRSTQVREIGSHGTRAEHPLPPDQDHGFLWRQNTYWSYEERDGGLYIQVESISLTRSIPTGLGWAVGPYIESIPRESLEFTLRCICKALHASLPS